jgi:hypothetical protein
VLHGGSLMFLKRDGPTVESQATADIIVAPERSPTSTVLTSESKESEVISIPEMREIQRSGAPNMVLDVRAERNLTESDLRAQGAARIPPDRAVERLTELDVPRQTRLFAFCA